MNIKHTISCSLMLLPIYEEEIKSKNIHYIITPGVIQTIVNIIVYNNLENKIKELKDSLEKIEKDVDTELEKGRKDNLKMIICDNDRVLYYYEVLERENLLCTAHILPHNFWIIKVNTEDSELMTKINNEVNKHHYNKIKNNDTQ